MATKIGQLAQSLADANPWWRDPDWANRDRVLRNARAVGLGYRSDCLADLEPGGLYLVRGPRRVGKTVAMKQKIEDLIAAGVRPQAIVRIATDHWSADQLRTVIQNVALPPLPEDEIRWWLLDEVTSVTGDWATQLKWLRDEDPGFGDATVVLTGSNASALTGAVGVLTGRRGQVRRRDRTMLPIGFRSFARLLVTSLPDTPRLALHQLHGADAEDAYKSMLPWLGELVRLWEVYLQYGGFPVAVAAARTASPISGWFLDDIFDAIFRDAFAASHLSQTETTALAERLVQTMASPANLSKIGADLGINQEVIVRHTRYLRDAYLLWTCPQRAETTWTARERAQDKLYAIDPIVARLAHLRNAARRDVDLTVLNEMQIGLVLQRNAIASGTTWADDLFLFHQRTPTRKEIDFVAEPMAPVAVEGKYTESGSWLGEAATVRASEFLGILATRNVLDTSHADAWAIPAGIFAYLVDT